MPGSTALLNAVRAAVHRTPGSFVSPTIGASLLPGMGIGIVARERIPKDTLVFQAGYDAWYPFSAECATKEAQFKAPGFVHQLEGLFRGRGRDSYVPNAIVLGMHLVFSSTRGRNPPPEKAGLQDLYASSLPNFVDLPFFWDEKQFEALDGCHEVRDSIQRSARTYFNIYQHLFGSNNQAVPADAFFWAISILMSRATSGKGQPFTLIPFFDWFNHADRGDECIQEYDDQHGFTIHTTRAYKPGEQLCINYGSHGNTKLLRNYGFTLSDNRHDILKLRLPERLRRIQPNDPMSDQKHSVLESMGVPSTIEFMEIRRDGNLTNESSTFLQLQLANREEMDVMINRANSELLQAKMDTNSLIPSSLRSRLHKEMNVICEDRLVEHSYSIEHDEGFLVKHQSEMANWLRCALRIRLKEKQILREMIRRTSD